MAFDDFEKELFDDLEGYQSDMNLDQEWQDLEARLPKKKRRIFFWLFPGGVLLSLLVIVLFFYEKDDGFESNKGASVTIGKHDTEKEINPSASRSTLANINDDIEITKNKSFNNKSVTPIVTKSKSLKQHIYKSELPVNVTIQLANSLPTSISQKTVSQMDGKKEKTEKLSNLILSKPNNESSVVALRKKIKDKISIDFIPLLSFYLSSKNPKIELPESQQVNKEKITPSPSEVKWGIAFGSTYGFNQFERITSPPINNQLDLVAQYETPVDYLGVHFKLYKKLNKHFSVFSGLVISQHTNVFELGDEFEAERESEEMLLEAHYLLSGTTAEIYGTSNVFYDISIQSKLWQKYQSFSIPIGISFCTSTDKKWSVQNDLALLWSPSQTTKGRKIIRTESDYFIFNNNTYAKINFASVSNQLSLNWKIKDRLFLQWTIDGGLDLSSRLNTEVFYDLRFSYLATGLGVKYLF